MNKLIYNFNTYQLNEIDFTQILVVGQQNAINVSFYFQDGSAFKVDYDWEVWITFERPDGQTSNVTLATLDNDHYVKKIGSWFTEVAGIGKVYATIKLNGEVIAPFAVANLKIFDGSTPAPETITNEQYNQLLSNVNDVNNKLETHIHDKNNPHDVNADQLNVYEKEHIDEIDERVNDIAENIDGNVADIIQLKTDVNQNTNDISSLGGRVSVNESGISVLNTRVLSNEQSLLLTAKLSEVIGMIQEHNNNEESHQYILRLIATVQAGGVKPLVFDTLAQLENWLNAGTVEHQGFVPSMLQLGQTLYTIPQNEMDYWVSKLPVLELADLTPFTGEADLSNYVQQSELLPINTAIAQLGIDVEASVKKVAGKDLSTNDYGNTDKAAVNKIPTIEASIIDINNNIGNKVDKVSGKALSANDYTNVDKAAVAEIPTLKTDVGNKVDKVAGKGLSTNDYSTAEKNKLAGLESSKFLGQFTNSSLLPTGSLGSYAYVDAGIGSDVQKFIWDTTDNKWVQAGVVTQDITPAQVKSLYESNADTNAFTDNEQSKLAGIQVGAEKNPTPLTNAQIKTQYEANTNTNAYTDAEKTKLSGIAVGAQVNPYTKTELDTKYDSKVDKVTGKQLSTNDYTTTEKTKLAGIATGAQVNPTGSQIKTLYEGNNDTNAFTDAEKVLVGKINDKVDKETGKQLSDQNFTLAEKSKLAGLESSKYIGQFTTKAALDAVTGTTGSYGYVDAGAGTDVKIYIWDTTDNKWVEGGGAVENLTPAQIKTMYESNADTNVFSDTEKSKLSNIEAGAQKNLAPLTNAEIKTKYEANSNTNAFTDAEKNKLSGLQAGAQVNTVTSVAGKTGAVVLAKADVGLGSVQNYAIASKTQAESGTSNVLYMTPLRTKELITVVMGDIESALDAILGV